jgi:predicted P-loop ATPase
MSTARFAHRYCSIGLHVIPIPPRSKAPDGNDWPHKAISDPVIAERYWKDHPDDNIGVVLGPSKLVSLDVDDVEAARTVFHEFGIDIDLLRTVTPTIVGNPARFRMQFRAPQGVTLGRKSLTWPRNDGSAKSFTVFELRAGNVQDVLPPSIHPDTLQPYVWSVTPQDGAFPALPTTLLAMWREWDVFKRQAQALCPWVTVAKPSPMKPREKRGDTGLIDAWNQAHPIETMLAQYGYSQHGRRWLSPHSGTKLPGVVQHDGKWFMHHASDPLFSEHPFDSYDLFKQYAHGGDNAAAWKDACRILDWKKKEPAPAAVARDVPHESTHTSLEEVLVTNREGTPVATLDNCVKVLERDPLFAGTIWYDTFLAKILHRWGVDIDTEWADHNDIALALHFQRVVGIPRVTSRMAGEAVVAYAMREKRNCAYDWLDGLEWDQRQRLQDIAVKGFGTPGNPYEVAVCRNLILSMVKRIFEPGCKSDYMPIFEGPQGVGKSRALGIIGGAWFAESHESVTSKDFYGVLQGKWLIEIAEMHAFKQADVDKIKGIVSCAVDRYRVPYGRHTADYARQCAFAGTTNRDDWNRDDTGARRFWPIKCGRIDHAWLTENRAQLFAEAVAYIRYNDEQHWVVPWDTASSEQESRRHEDTWEIMFEQYVREEPAYEDFQGHRLDQPTWKTRAEPLTETTVFNFLTEGMNMLPSRISRGDEMRAGRAMKMCGWERRQKRVGDKRQWIYVVP